MIDFVRTNKRYFLVLLAILWALNLFLVSAHFLGMPLLTRLKGLVTIPAIADSVAAALMVAEMFNDRNKTNRLIHFYAMAWMGIAVQTWSVLIANLVDPMIPTGIAKVGLLHQCIVWSGNYTKSYAVFLVALYQRGLINGIRQGE